MLFKIEAYEDENGKSVILEFLKKLKKSNRDLRAKTDAVIYAMKESENQHTPHWKPLKDGLFEIRSRTKGNITRIYCCYGKNRVIFLLVGITDKKDEQRAITKARKIKEKIHLNEKLKIN